MPLSKITSNSTNFSSDTRALSLPVGTTANRSGSPAAGQIRYNSSTQQPEWYDPTSTTWRAFSSPTVNTYEVQYLIIAGGGGGGSSYYGDATGGGAGGYRCNVPGENSGGSSNAEGPYVVVPGLEYKVVIGSGGAPNTPGTNSSFGELLSYGGGAAGSHRSEGFNGGSGGGSGAYYDTPDSGTGGFNFVGQGTQGGSRRETTVGPLAGAGGGGAASRPSSGSINGGSGLASSITGTSVTRAGGGAGGSSGSSAGSGGSGGGGNGVLGNNTAGSGSTNTGSGGGGASGSFSTAGSPGSGGSGIVIVRYWGGQRATGGTVTSSRGFTIHTFTSSGTFTA